MNIENFIQSFKNISAINNPLFWLAAILIQMILLFIYYPVIERNINLLGQRFFGGNTIAIYYLFFVGTVIHELSHLLACLLLWVRVGNVNFFGPKQEKDGGTTLGYVEHAVTGPIRGTLIGIAPLFGCAFFTYLVFVWVSPELSILSIPTLEELFRAFIHLLTNPFSIKNIIFLYIVIACALAGTPSPADLTSVPFAIILLVILGGLIYLAKNSINWNFLGNTINQATFLTPPLMLVGTVLSFELGSLALVHLISSLLIRKIRY